MAGWQAGDYEPLTPEGGLEQADDLLSGIGQQPGRQRVAARLTAVVLLLILVTGVAAGVFYAVR